MIRLIDDLPDNVLGLEAVGEVRAGDYKAVLDPAIDAALETHDTINLLYVLGDEFEGYSGGAMWEDTKVGMSHLNRWNRVCLVTDSKVYSDGAKLFGWMFPGGFKVFPTSEEAAAREWISS